MFKLQQEAPHDIRMGEDENAIEYDQEHIFKHL